MNDLFTDGSLEDAYKEDIQNLGPIYNVELISALPFNYRQEGGMKQAMPSRDDLKSIKDYRQGQRVVAGYEVLLNHWRAQQKHIAELNRHITHLATKIDPTETP